MFRCTDAAASFYERVFFKTELSSYTKKSTQQLEYFRHLALETIHKIPCDVLQIYIDGIMGVSAVSGIAIRVKQDIGSTWIQAPVHEWYEETRRDAALLGTSSRRDEATLARLRSGHPSCMNCNVTQVTPTHILACIGCYKSQLLSSAVTVIHCLKMQTIFKRYMHLIKMFLPIKRYKKHKVHLNICRVNNLLIRFQLALIH
ncbi:hypothetical protein TNCV_3618011 [Trichonephila clavipes]|nr:hypothetical protein TNCV_3618011 [Trichonephila clavipes]